MNEHEGPTTWTHSRQSCMGCKWHEQAMMKSGLHPIYNHYCEHPLSTGVSEKERGTKGKWIGQSDATPTWCPVLREKDKAEQP